MEPRQPLYTDEDVEKTVSLIQVLDYNESMQAAPGVTFRLRDAGHVIGSSIVELFVENEESEETKTVFSGDLGQ